VNESRQEGPDVRQWWGQVRRRKWLLLAIVIALPVGVYLVSSQLPKTYQARAVVQVQGMGSALNLLGGGRANLKTEVTEAKALVRTPPVAGRAARILGRPPIAAKGLTGHVSVTSATDESGSNFLAIIATAHDPIEAANIANAFAKGLSKARVAQRVQKIDLGIRSLEARIEKSPSTAEGLEKSLQELELQKESLGGATPLVEEATPPAAPVSPKPRRNTILAFVLALLLSAALIPLLERLDRRVRNPSELEDLLDAPVLAVVSDDAFPGHPPSFHVRESFETLRASLTYFNVDRTLSSLVVASPIPQDGKTTVAINLAIAYALDERDVVLIDGDLRRPQVAARLGREVSVGLDSVLVGQRTLDEALAYVDVGAGRLRILPGAVPPPNPAVLLGSQRMRMLIAELSEQVDIVVIDTPGLLACSDAIPLFSQVSGNVMVARLSRTPRDVVRRTRQVIESAGGDVLGSVVTGAHTGGVYGYYGYGGYYGYYGSNGAEDVAANGSGRLRNLGGLRRSRS